VLASGTRKRDISNLSLHLAHWRGVHVNGGPNAMRMGAVVDDGLHRKHGMLAHHLSLLSFPKKGFDMSAKINVEKKWKLLVAWLKENFPPQHPVRVLRVSKERLPGDFADGDLIKGTFRIRIMRNASFQIKVDSLLHEWAHLLTWYNDTKGDEDPHFAEWGVAQARIYRRYCKWDFGRTAKKEGPKFLPDQTDFLDSDD